MNVKLKKNRGGKHGNGILPPFFETYKVVKCLIASKKAFANKAHQIVFPTKYVIFTLYFNVDYA